MNSGGWKTAPWFIAAGILITLIYVGSEFLPEALHRDWIGAAFGLALFGVPAIMGLTRRLRRP